MNCIFWSVKHVFKYSTLIYVYVIVIYDFNICYVCVTLCFLFISQLCENVWIIYNKYYGLWIIGYVLQLYLLYILVYTKIYFYFILYTDILFCFII